VTHLPQPAADAAERVDAVHEMVATGREDGQDCSTRRTARRGLTSKLTASPLNSVFTR